MPGPFHDLDTQYSHHQRQDHPDCPRVRIGLLKGAEGTVKGGTRDKEVLRTLPKCELVKPDPGLEEAHGQDTPQQRRKHPPMGPFGHQPEDQPNFGPLDQFRQAGVQERSRGVPEGKGCHAQEGQDRQEERRGRMLPTDRYEKTAAEQAARPVGCQGQRDEEMADLSGYLRNVPL